MSMSYVTADAELVIVNNHIRDTRMEDLREKDPRSLEASEKKQKRDDWKLTTYSIRDSL